jgi:hypothetical protein
MDYFEETCRIEKKGIIRFEKEYPDEKSKKLFQSMKYVFCITELKMEMANLLYEIDRQKLEIEGLKMQIK